MSTIREELMEATSIKPKKKEDEYTFIKRLIAAVEDLEDDGWGSLSTEAQEYTNSVVAAKKKYDDWDEMPPDEVPTFPDETSEGEETEETGEEAKPNDGDTTEDEGEQEVEKPAKKPGKTAGKEKPAEKRASSKEKEKPAAKAAKSNGSGKKVSAIHRIRQIVVKKPKISTEDLVAQLIKEGFTTSKMTVGTTKQGTRDTMKALVAAGMLEADL